MLQPTDIFIKSFNRPYYLERCIRSIHHYVKGDYQVTVLDDGTPSPYLERIQHLFPTIKILKSDLYIEKSEAIKKHISGEYIYANTKIPVQFWKNSIATASSIFLLLEEDAWFIDSINLNEVQSIFSATNTVILKLAWNGNESIVQGRKKYLSYSTEEIKSKLPLQIPFITKAFIKNSLKIRSLLIKSGLMTSNFILPYYVIYTVTSAFFDKVYWLYLWPDSQSIVNETTQLIQALGWKQEHPNSQYAKTKHEVIKTSFITSCANKYSSVTFDLVRLNHYLNEAWMEHELDASQNLPHDFTLDYLCTFVDRQADINCTSSQWLTWIEVFKNDFRSTGCIVD
jgi:hypothetical protein